MIDLDLIDWEWIESHRNCDPKQLSLKYGKEKRFEIIQIECRQRAEKKLPETLKNQRFLFPSILSSMQATSDHLADIHARIIGNCRSVLDMTCGLAIDSFRIAANADKVTSIDINSDYIDIAKWNASCLGLDNIDFINADSVEWLTHNPVHFDAIYIDPARRDSNNRRCFDLKDCYPDVTTLVSLFKSRTRKVIIKASPMLDVDALISQLTDISSIYAVGTVKECKELLIVLEIDSTSQISLHSVTSTGKQTYISDFPFKYDSFSIYSSPEVGGYIYLPYPAIMKIGHLDYIAANTGVHKISRDTHVFYSSKSIAQFPGLGFRILKIMPFDKHTIKEFSSYYPEINVTAKNFPLNSSALAKKLKIKEGGSLRLFALTLNDHSRKLIVCDNL